MIYLNFLNNLIICSVFIIDFEKKFCFIFIYLVSIGCNFNEIFRVIDFL